MIYFALAVLGLIIVLLIPTSDSLPVVGQRSLAILTFAVILWVTQAVSYEVSAVMIIVLVSFLVGLSPTIEDPSVLYGTKEDRKSTRLNSSHVAISYAVFCLKKKKNKNT